MKKYVSLILAVSITLCFILVPSMAYKGYPLLEQCELTDYVIGRGYSVVDLKTGESVPFTYTAPDGGAVIIVFLFSTYDYNPTYSGSAILQYIAGSPLISNDKIKVIAVESSGAGAEDTESFVSGCLGDKLDRVDVYYGNQYLVWEYCRSLGMAGSITPPILLISADVAGQPTVLFKNQGSLNYGRFTNSVASLCSDVSYVEDSYIEEIKVSGTELYGEIADIYNRVNEHRANEGLKPLALSDKITQLAMKRAAECAVYYDHTRPNGDSCFSVDEDGIYENSVRYLNAENIAAGYPTGAEVIEAWIKSPGHNANILNARSDCIGIGAFESDGIRYWVQLFGVGDDPDAVTETASVPSVYNVDIKRSVIGERYATTSSVTVNKGQTVEMPFLRVRNGSGHFSATIIPFADQEVRDAGGELIATVSESGGRLYVKGCASGEGDILCRAYESDIEPITLHIIVNAYVLPVLVYGDANDDGVVDGKDLIRLRKFLSSEVGTAVSAGADANGDGVTDGRDIIALKKYLAGYDDDTKTSDHPLGPQ